MIRFVHILIRRINTLNSSFRRTPESIDITGCRIKSGMTGLAYLVAGLILNFIILLLIPPSVVMAETELSDEKKKAIVYEMYRNYKKNNFPQVKDIDPQKALELLKNKKIIFIDTRKKTEMEISMLPNAISKKAFLSNQGKYSDKVIVAYCTISYRSGLFAREMANKKIRVHNLSGGLLAWVLEGGRVYDHAGETKRIHVYGKKWNYPAKGYTPVMFGFFDRFF